MGLVSAPIHFVLASASPARRRLLLQAGVEPTVYVSDVDEEAVEADARERYGDLGPADLALLLARAKAEAVAAELHDGDHVVLGCDSVLELDGAIHGKPADSSEAIRRWRAMRGRSGILHTGHWLVDDRADSSGGTGGAVGASVDTAVHFADLDDREIEDYVATGEPLRVAGAFTIDGLGAPYVKAIEGDHTNVVGLSLPTLRELLLDVGIHWSQVMTPR